MYYFAVQFQWWQEECRNEKVVGEMKKSCLWYANVAGRSKKIKVSQ